MVKKTIIYCLISLSAVSFVSGQGISRLSNKERGFSRYTPPSQNQRAFSNRTQEILQRCLSLRRILTPRFQRNFFWFEEGEGILPPNFPPTNGETAGLLGTYTTVGPGDITCNFHNPNEPEITVEFLINFVMSDGTVVLVEQVDNYLYDESTDTWSIEIFFPDGNGGFFLDGFEIQESVVSNCRFGGFLCSTLTNSFNITLIDSTTTDPATADAICRSIYASVGLTPPEGQIVGCFSRVEQETIRYRRADPEFALVNTVPLELDKGQPKLPLVETFATNFLNAELADGTVVEQEVAPRTLASSNDRNFPLQ